MRGIGIMNRRRWRGVVAAALLAVGVVFSAGTTPAVAADPTYISIDECLPATEGDAHCFSVYVSNFGSQTVTVNYTAVSGTAKSGSDFLATSGKLTFAPDGNNWAQQYVQVPTIDDTVDEARETFSVKLSRAVNATLWNTSATGQITDNDFGPSKLTASAYRYSPAFQPMPIGCAPGFYCPYWRSDFNPVPGWQYTVVSARLTDNFDNPAYNRQLEFSLQDPTTGLKQTCTTTASSCTFTKGTIPATGHWEVRFLGDAELGANSVSGDI